MKAASFLFCLAALTAASAVKAQTAPPNVTGDARVDKLLSEMTLQEKMDLIRGTFESPATAQGQAGYLPGVPRLGIPSLRFADGPPGVLTRHASQAETATMGVAATFSVQDALENGVVIGRQDRSHGIAVSLQPFINIARDFTFTRAYNTFGEDPFLTSVMGAEEIRGIQSQDVMAMAKHYVGYDSNSFDTSIDRQTLHQIYLAPFAAAVKAGVASIMCSYNKVNGAFACGNSHTLETILRGQLGFKGFVTSDWGAVHNVHFIDNGLDMEMPGLLPPGNPMGAFLHSYFQTTPRAEKPAPALDAKALAGMLGGTIPEEPQLAFDLSSFPREAGKETMRDALRDGSVTEATITQAAGRVLYEMDRFGYLDGKEKQSITPQALAPNDAVILKTAEDAAVLLKNEDRILPLGGSALKSLALIGPGAGQLDAIGVFGERSPGLVSQETGPLAALRQDAADDAGVNIAYAVADDMTGTPVPAAQLSHDGKPGLERIAADGSTQIDRELNFTLSDHRSLPANTSWTWKGTLTVPEAGSYWLYLQVLGARGSISVDGNEIGRTGAVKGAVHGDVQYATQDNVFPTTDGLDNVRRAVELTAGTHTIAVKASPDTSGNPEQVRLNWMTPRQRKADYEHAIATAKSAGTAVVFVWSRGKPAFELPGDQNKLIEQIADVNANTIVVMNVSQPVAMPWLNKVKAVLQMWWPGDEGGWATANVLLGKADPGGKLPFTWAYKLTDYPATDPAHPERSAKGVDGKTTYSEGIFVGYRWFDREKIKPLFPFGYGLSYTTMEFSEIHALREPNGGMEVSVTVKNTGPVAGDAVPEVYLGAPKTPPAGVPFAARAFCGFDRVRLSPQQSRTVVMQIPLLSLQYWSTADGRWETATGARTIDVGGSSRDLPLQMPVMIQ
ncbi:MAG: beta-glucosidase family protein [Terracidiphilus sp.]